MCAAQTLRPRGQPDTLQSRPVNGADVCHRSATRAERAGEEEAMPPGIRPADASALTPLTSPILVGREEERRLLVRLAEHPPALGVVEGGAGMGKSRLVAELARSPSPATRRILVGACQPLREPFPLGPVVDALRTLREPPARAVSAAAGALRPHLPDLADKLPPLPQPSRDPRADRHLLFQGVRELLAHIGPTVCVLEDLHWCDEGTVEFLNFLVARLPPTLSLVLTYRREHLLDGAPLLRLGTRVPSGVAASTIHLAPLSVPAVRQLVGAILGTDEVSEAFARHLHARTGGIPFAVEEVVRLIQDRRHIVRHGDRWLRRSIQVLAVPSAVRESVLERAAGCGSEARAIVEAAAVLDAPARADLLFAVAGLQPAPGFAGLRRALEAGVLVEVRPTLHTLRHSLANQAIYESIPGALRQEMHRRAAAALETADPPPVVQLAHHHREAGGRAGWLRYAEAAADLATSRGDNESAARLLREALLTPGLMFEDRNRLAVALGWAAVRALSGQEGSVAALRRFLDDPSTPAGVRGEVRSLLGSLLRVSGHAAEGCVEQARAVDELTDRPDLAARVMTHLAYPWVGESAVEDHLGWLARAAETAKDQPDEVVKLAVRCAHAYVLTYIGDPAGPSLAAKLPWATADGGASRELAWTALELAMGSLLLGRYAAARGHVDDASRIARDLGLTSLAGDIDTDLLLLDWATGAWGRLADRALLHAEATADIPRQSVSGHLIAGLLALAQGDPDGAEVRLGAAVDMSKAAGLMPAVAVATGGLARLHTARGDVVEARSLAEGVLEIVRRKRVWPWAAEVAPAAVMAMLANGDVSAARALVDELASGLCDHAAPLAQAAQTWCHAMIAEAMGDLSTAIVRCEAARLAYASLPRPYEVALVREAGGRCRFRETADGGAELLAALDDLDALGAAGDADRVRRTLKQLGVARPSQAPYRGGRRGYGSMLSPQEHRAAELAARGLTNVQVGEALVLSARTVEKHIAGAMRKLGVTSRAGLAARWAMDHGLEPDAGRPDARSGRLGDAALMGLRTTWRASTSPESEDATAHWRR